MINILYIGNCQVKAYSEILHINNSNVNVIECYNTNINEYELLTIIQNTNIIITQHINDDYKNKPFLSTKFLLENCKKDCIIIILDVCYFDFYHIDADYKLFNDKLLQQPISYHYNNMIYCYKNNLSINYYIENFVNNLNLKTLDELETIAINNITELKNRYECNIERYKDYKLNINIETCYEFIRDNYKEKYLFYFKNHPSKYVLQYNCNKIIEILKKYLLIDYCINYDIDPLNGIQCIIYKCVQKCVNFDINNYVPSINLPPYLMLSGINETIELYYKTYDKINFI